MNAPIPLSLPRDPEEIGTAFTGDCMDRRAFAETVTPALRQLAVNGGVMTLDAPWGEGKSWFGRHWRKRLDDQGQVQTCWIDAFEQDYIEDPFELVAAELIDAMDWRENEELIDKTVFVMSVLGKTLGALAKAVGKGVGALGAAAHPAAVAESKAIEAAGTVAGDFVAQAVTDGNAWIKERLLSHSKEKAAIRDFREAMRAQLANAEKPLVVFVDELDRCRPDFAVRLLECIKHFFDVPNLVFVLLLNRDQLEKAVKGIYGAEVDAHLYLQKFVHLPLRLPKGGQFPENNLRRVIRALFHDRFRFTQNVDEWSELITIYARALDLSLRDLERVVALLIVCPLPPIPIVAFAVCLKIKNNAWFSGYRRSDSGTWNSIHLFMQMNLGQDYGRNADLKEIKDFIGQWLDVAKELDEGYFGRVYRGRSNLRERYAGCLSAIDTGLDVLR